jgi:ornithine cyclodeaminase/alanine dehydrogenase-like protein (mu-crystallin family)
MAGSRHDDGRSDLRHLPIIEGAEVAGLLPYEVLVEALDAAHQQKPPLSKRSVLSTSDDSDQSFLALAAWRPREALGVKLATVFPANLGHGQPSVQAIYVLFDPTTGAPAALIDGTELTYRKTAADSALGARFLARDDANTLLVIGAGGLAAHLVAAHRVVRPTIRNVLVWNRTRARAEALANSVGGVVVDTVEAGVAEADVITTATMSSDPLIAGRWLRPGTHLDLVGSFRPDQREADDETVTRSELYVDHRDAALGEAGDLLIPRRRGLIADTDIRGDLYDLCRGDVSGRTASTAITLFKNGGGGHLDLMTATTLWERRSS